MIVIFKLTCHQTFMAQKIKEKVEKVAARRPRPDGQETYYAGNLVGELVKHPFTNTNASLQLLDDGTVICAGDRNALSCDGAFEVLAEVAQNDYRNLIVSYYSSSNRDMEWWETSPAYLNRLKEEELMEWFKNHKTLTSNEAAAVADRARELGLHPIKPGSSTYLEYQALAQDWMFPHSETMFKALLKRADVEEVNNFLKEVGLID